MPPSLRRCAVGTAVLLVALSGPLVAPSRASDLSEESDSRPWQPRQHFIRPDGVEGGEAVK